MKVSFVPATEEHVATLVASLSPTIAKELTDKWPGMSAEEVVKTAFSNSYDCYMAFADNDLVCALGIMKVNMLSDWARPWLIPHATNINKYKFPFLKASKEWIRLMADKHGVLETPARNKKAQHFLKWLGFAPSTSIDGFTHYVFEGAK